MDDRAELAALAGRLRSVLEDNRASTGFALGVHVTLMPEQIELLERVGNAGPVITGAAVAAVTAAGDYAPRYTRQDVEDLRWVLHYAIGGLELEKRKPEEIRDRLTRLHALHGRLKEAL